MGISHPEMWARFSDITRPLVRRHPVTLSRFIYLNEKWLERIEELDHGESTAMLESLYRRMSESPFHYRHQWKAGQILIWDNNIVAHKAFPVTDGSRKITWRIIVEDYRRREAQV